MRNKHICLLTFLVCFVVRRKMDSMPKTISNQQKKKKTPWTDTAEKMLVEMWEEKIQQLRGNRKNQHVYAEIASELRKNGFPASPLNVKNKVHNLTKRYRTEKLLVGPSGGSPSHWPLYERLHCMLGSYKYYNVQQITCDSILAPSAASTSAGAASLTEESILGLELMYTDECAASAPSPQRGSAPSAPPSPSTSIEISDIPSSSPVVSAIPSLSIAESPTPTLPGKKIKFQQQIINKIEEVSQKIDTQVNKMDQMDNKMYNLECKKADMLEKLVTKQSAVMDALLDYIKTKK